MSARPALRALVDRTAASPPTPGPTRSAPPTGAQPANRRTYLCEQLKSNPTASVGFVSYNWLEAATLFSKEEITSLLGDHVIRHAAIDFLFRSEPGSDIERHIGRKATAELRASAILHLPNSQLILKYSRTLPLTWQPANDHPVVHPAAVCALVTVLSAMPPNSPEFTELLTRLRDEILSLFDPPRGIEALNEILHEIRAARGNSQVHAAILEMIDAARRRYDGRQRTLHEWCELVASRITA